MDEKNIHVSSNKWHDHKLPLAEFKEIYDGVILMAGVPENYSAPAAIPKGAKNIFIAVVIMLMLTAGVTYHTNYFASLNWQILLLTVLKTAGLITSVLLLVQSIDANNPLVQKLCRAGKKLNCNAILSSKAATVFKGLTWSEAGFFYFAGTWLITMFGGNSIQWQTLLVLNLISLPYTVYSVCYQARVAKQWCILCCTVQAILWLEFITLISKNDEFVKPDINALSTVIICLFTPVVLWLMLKPLLLKAKQLQPLKDQLRAFKYNTDLFNKLLATQPKYAHPDEEWSIVLGNVEADNIVTMVSNPYCPPCSKTHELLHKLITQNENIQARIVFTADNTDEDRKTPVSRHIMALSNQKNEEKLKQALHDWYGQKQKNYEAWAKVYPVNLVERDFYKLDKQKHWCDMAGVTHTPTLLLNGYRLPELYQLSDLKYML